jgi:hypothetical protein
LPTTIIVSLNWKGASPRLEYLKSIKQSEIDGTENKEISITLPSGQTRQFSGQRLLLGNSLPNFYFHATTAYDIIRQCGVEIGKRDFMGAPPSWVEKGMAHARYSKNRNRADGRKSMHYKAKSISALHIALGGLPGHMRIEAEAGVDVNLVIITPPEDHVESVVKLSKVSVATHYPPRR